LILSNNDLDKWVNNFINFNGCECKNCSQNILLSDFHAVLHFQEQYRDLSSNFREDLIVFFVYQAIMNADNWYLLRNNKVAYKRIKINYSIEPFGIVCRGVFRKLLSLSDKKLRNILDHVKSENFPIERVHSSLGKAHNTLSDNTTKSIEKWIIKLSNQLGEPKWKDITTKNDLEYVMLPACYSVSILTSMCRKDLGNLAFSRSTFYGILKSDACKHIKIRSPRTDMCSTCERIKVELRSLYQKRTMELIEDIPELISDEFNRHINSARTARMDYRSDQQKAKDGLISHFSFDFAQNLTLPQCSDQPGDLYFRSLRNIYLFGIVDESNNLQTNYLVDEGDMAKGANEVISMLWHYLQRHRKTIKPKLVLNADNTVGQNKNKTLMRFLAWLCATKFVSEIEIKFMVVGHTHFLVDANFGHIKRLYQRSNAYCIEHLSDIVTASAKSNKSTMVTHKDIFDYTTALSENFVAIPKIGSNYYFKFSSAKPWVVHVRSSNDSAWAELQLMKENTPIKKKEEIEAQIQSLKHLDPIGISCEKKVDFYDKIRKFVPEKFKDTLCPKPTKIEREKAKGTKSQKRKENNKKST
jgi:hypothetical protein